MTDSAEAAAAAAQAFSQTPAVRMITGSSKVPARSQVVPNTTNTSENLLELHYRESS